MASLAKKTMKIVQILLFSLLAVIPMGQILRLSFLDGLINVLALDILVFIIVIAYLVNKRNFLSISKTYLFRPILAFLVVAVISLVLNLRNFSLEEIGISSLYLLRFMFYAGIYFVLSGESQTFKRKFTYGLLLSGFVFTLFGLFQYFLYPDLRNLYYLGWDEHLYRLFSTFLDPNFAGAFLVLELLLIYSFVFNSFKESWKKVGLAIMSFLTFIALLFTYSRSSYIMFIFSFTLLLIIYKRVHLLVFFLALFIFGILLLPKGLPSEGVNLLRTASIDARTQEAENAIEIIKNNFVFGVGFNTYRFAKRAFGFLEDNYWRQIHSGAGAENSFLFVLATTGIIGFFAFLYLLFKIAAMGKSAGNGVLLTSLAALIVHSLFVNSLFYPNLIVWLWIIAGLTRRQ